MIRLAISNLFERKTRTLISISGVAAQVAFVVVLIGLSTGTLEGVGERIEKVGSDIMVLPPGSSYILSLSSAVVPLVPVKAALEATEGVRMASPIVIATTNRFGDIGMIFGIEPKSYQAVGRGSFKLLEGRGLEDPFDMVIDKRQAISTGLEVGDTIDVLGHDFFICGIVAPGAGVRMYMLIATVQDLLGRYGKASLFFVRTHSPDLVSSTVDELKRSPAFKGYKLIPNAQYAEFLGSHTFGIKEFIAAVTLMAVVFGFFVISLAMYTSIMERTRMIGILKSLGADPSFIAATFVIEAALISLISVPIGLGFAYILKAALQAQYPTLIIMFTAKWMIYTTLIALAAGFLGSIYPSIRAARVDPIVALGYE